MLVKIGALPNWPPEPGGAFNVAYKSPSSGQAAINEIVTVQDRWVTFTGSFEGKEFTYDYKAATVKIATALAQILRMNVGTTVMRLGESEIEI
jgi:hypothetical protein